MKLWFDKSIEIQVNEFAKLWVVMQKRWMNKGSEVAIVKTMRTWVNNGIKLRVYKSIKRRVDKESSDVFSWYSNRKTNGYSNKVVSC